MDTKKVIEGFTIDDHKIIVTAYKIMKPKIREYLLYNSGSESDVHDILWESFERFQQKCQKGELPVIPDWQRFMYGIVRNVWREKFRRKRPFLSLEDILIKNTPSGNSDFEQDVKELVKQVKKAITNMSEICRQTLTLVYARKKTNKEIAQSLNISAATFGKRLSDCRNRLRVKIQNDPLFANFEGILYNFI